MPRLYCEEHGREHEAIAIGEQEHYRQLGEAVLIVKGRLISGPWLCDRCNAMLSKSTPAWLVSSFGRHFVEELDCYDYSYERRYFTMERAEARWYGAGVAMPETS